MHCHVDGKKRFPLEYNGKNEIFQTSELHNIERYVCV